MSLTCTTCTSCNSMSFTCTDCTSCNSMSLKHQCFIDCIGDWKADGYRWYQNGRKHLPSSNPVVTKTYYVLLVEGMTGPVKNKEFRKVVHHLADDPKGVEGTLIQYLGKFW